MHHSASNPSLPKTLQDIEQAVQQYWAADFRGEELYQRWRAIREASLQQGTPESQYDHIPGEESY
jgi:hypothetical protein